MHELLRTACARIEDLHEPAFIKDSTLNYVAVNRAYAALFDMEPRELVGHPTRDRPQLLEHPERKEKECRALIFGTEETVRCLHASGALCHEITIERFVTEDDRTYLFGSFQPAGEAGQVAVLKSAGGGENAMTGDGNDQELQLEDALDLLDVGIGIYDEADTLVYYNAQLSDFFDSFGVRLRIGVTFAQICEQVYEKSVRNSPRLAGREAPNSSVWVQERIRTFRLPYSENIEQLSDGRWLKSVNKRLDNGLVITLRSDVTDFKDQELLLRKNIGETEILRAVLEDLPVAVFMRDAEQRLEFVNAAYEEMFGDKRENILGKTDAEMFPWKAERSQTENDRILAEGEAVEKAEDKTFPDGRVIPVITRQMRVVDADGQPHLVGSITDITPYKQAKEHAEKLRQDMQTILHGIPVGIGILDGDFVFEYANPAFYGFWDAGEQFELVGRPYRDFMRAMFDNGIYGDVGTLSFEEIYQRRIADLTQEGERPPIEARSAQGRVILISGTRLSGNKLLLSYMDITAIRKRDEEVRAAQQALDRQGVLMREATSAMSQGLLILHEGTIVFSNNALPAMLEIPESLGAPGSLWRDVFRFCVKRGDLGPTDEAMEILRRWEENVSEGRSVQATFRIEGRKWVNVEAKLSGSEHWLAVFTDVTDVKDREAELTRLVDRAEAADRAKSEFLANMSHEIRTPMNGVLGMAELLAKSDLDTRQKTFIDIIVKSGNALLTIINDILDFSKIDAGQMKLRKAPFDPVEAIEDVATLLSSSAAEKDIELIVRGDASVKETVLGDAGRFRQIITNLVGNAIKFTEKGHVFIDLHSEAVSDTDMMLTVRIEDTGLGIPDEKLKSVFEKFSQVDTSSTRRHEGTGLGLAITAGLVELFGGHIEVTSEVGKGSVFTVHLPFPVVSERGTNTVLPINTAGARVLVIDDNAVNRRILTEQLTMWGFDTVAADGGAEGLAFMNEASRLGLVIDAVVLDYHMPEMNGLDAARHIRADRRFNDLGIIFLTSMDMAGDETLFAELNIQAHLMKPARANLLRATIIDVVRSVRMKRRAAPAAPVLQSAPEPMPSQPPALLASTPVVHSVPVLDVLVAEDNEVNQIVFTQILQGTGWRFEIVENGAKAVEAWQAKDPALILMDVSMPVMNGHQATQKIRELEKQTGGHVPIIGVTAHALESDKELCLAAGMDDYMSKPISPELLEQKIKAWLGEASASASSA
ncbi:hybrid sensor histidine kinase/response regulator [Pseudorhizobium endolithicum]|uniref:histidine kinase n=1 Tax=Pseudorhizobium endolithicum TaxID=1191678 RepID=A0ABN7JFU0_9HYPH|nr:response regulator [Pseudorhizobium endolithicum]CAD7024971.1 hybrid sensor histidine kinase/response regulator [Pseudorhizobium endolithicum]